jgi:hypothetical protein
MPIIRRFDPGEYSKHLSSIPTDDLIELMNEEVTVIWGIENEKLLIMYEKMFSLIKRELSLRGALQTMEWKS